MNKSNPLCIASKSISSTILLLVILSKVSSVTNKIESDSESFYIADKEGKITQEKFQFEYFQWKMKFIERKETDDEFENRCVITAEFVPKKRLLIVKKKIEHDKNNLIGEGDLIMHLDPKWPISDTAIIGKDKELCKQLKEYQGKNFDYLLNVVNDILPIEKRIKFVKYNMTDQLIPMIRFPWKEFSYKDLKHEVYHYNEEFKTKISKLIANKIKYWDEKVFTNFLLDFRKNMVLKIDEIIYYSTFIPIY